MIKDPCSGLSAREMEACQRAIEESDAEGQWISDELFTTEMKIMWRNLPVSKRNSLMNMVRGYFDSGDRGDKILYKLQESL